MVRFYERTDTFKYSWDQVAQAFWSRYPNPYSQHVLTEDVICRKVEDGKLYSKRLLTKTNPFPKWAEKLTNIRSVKVVEESIVDPVKKTIITYTRNIGPKTVMSVEEKCIYQPSEDLKWTAVERSAWISSSLFGFARAIQVFGVERFKKNAIKASRGFQVILDNMYPAAHHQENIIPLNVYSANMLVENKEKLKEKAKKATELAKSKASPLVAACSPKS